MASAREKKAIISTAELANLGQKNARKLIFFAREFMQWRVRAWYIRFMAKLTVSNRSKRKPAGALLSRKFPPGEYLVTRDPATVLGPHDLRRWHVTIKDCPGGLGVLELHSVNRDGAKWQYIITPPKWFRMNPSGRGIVDHQGERYLEMLAASPHITIEPYVAPEPLTRDEVLRFIACNGKACYRTLQASLSSRMPGITQAMRKFVECELRKARPKCGDGCDSGCPVSGRCEG